MRWNGIRGRSRRCRCNRFELVKKAGALEKALSRVCEQLERQVALRKRMIKKVSYPELDHRRRRWADDLHVRCRCSRVRDGVRQQRCRIAGRDARRDRRQSVRDLTWGWSAFRSPSLPRSLGSWPARGPHSPADRFVLAAGSDRWGPGFAMLPCCSSPKRSRRWWSAATSRSTR